MRCKPSDGKLGRRYAFASFANDWASRRSMRKQQSRDDQCGRNSNPPGNLRWLVRELIRQGALPANSAPALGTWPCAGLTLSICHTSLRGNQAFAFGGQNANVVARSVHMVYALRRRGWHDPLADSSLSEIFDDARKPEARAVSRRLVREGGQPACGATRAEKQPTRGRSRE